MVRTEEDHPVKFAVHYVKLISLPALSWWQCEPMCVWAQDKCTFFSWLCKSFYHWCVSALAVIYTTMCTPRARVRLSVFTAIILLSAFALWVCIRMPVKGTMACLVAFVKRGTDLISANLIVTIQLELNRHSRKTYIIPDRSIILTR